MGVEEEEKEKSKPKGGKRGEEERASARLRGHVAITCIFMQPHTRDRANTATDSETALGLIIGIVKITPNYVVTQHDNLKPY